MKKTVFLFFIFINFFSCKKILYNAVLERKGVFNDKIELQKLVKEDKEVVLFPISHLGTELFYQDVSNKIDSLKERSYFFYYEKIKPEKTDTLIFRKFRKVTLLPRLKNGYKGWMDSILKVRLKKELVNQPSYSILGLDSINSKNVDVTLKDMIRYYENNFKEIVLEPCDFETSIYEKSSCKDQKRDKTFKEEVILKYRNANVINSLDNDNYDKVAIIYGAAHITGIKEKLLKKGYK